MLDDNELVITRTFDAPRELVFRCLTQKEHLAQFWGPKGTHTPIDDIVIDLRPGGAYQTTMVGDEDGNRYTMSAVLDEVVPPERLVWTDTATGVVTTSTFTEVGSDRTEVEITMSNVPAFMREADARAGFLSSLDRFADYLGDLRSGITSQP
jgi:uncharacterized protein YndB with AHSA1/START domain